MDSDFLSPLSTVSAGLKYALSKPIPGNYEAPKFTIYWRIENFNSKPSNQFCINTNSFRIESMKSNWEIDLQVTGNNLEAWLVKTSNPKQFIVCFSIFLLTSSGWICICENLKSRFRLGGIGYGQEIVNLKRLIEDEWTYTPDGSFTISFQMWNDQTAESTQLVMVSRLRHGNNLCHRPTRTFSTLKPSDLFPFPFSFESHGNSTRSLCNQNTKETKTQHTQTDTSISLKDAGDLRKLFAEKDFSFVTLRTPTKEFLVHKAVLCAKSPVFNAMFERKMRENDSNVVDIEDIDSQTMSWFIKFMHFEPLEDFKWSEAVSLYYAADKYQTDSLKKECASLLNRELSEENVCDALLLADLHQDEDLMNYALEYFCKHSKAILPSPQWRDVLGHTELVAKVLCKLAEVRL